MSAELDREFQDKRIRAHNFSVYDVSKGTVVYPFRTKATEGVYVKALSLYYARKDKEYELKQRRADDNSKKESM